MGNGQWAMGNGQWAMGNGQWAMGNGQWAMGNKFRAAQGRLLIAKLVGYSPLTIHHSRFFKIFRPAGRGLFINQLIISKIIFENYLIF
jgi:hypothetical protein